MLYNIFIDLNISSTVKFST